MTSVTDIDAMLTAQKTLAGVARWIEDDRGTVAKLSVPLMQAGIIGGLVLRANATLHTDPQRGGCALIYQGRCHFCRTTPTPIPSRPTYRALIAGVAWTRT